MAIALRVNEQQAQYASSVYRLEPPTMLPLKVQCLPDTAVASQACTVLYVQVLLPVMCEGQAVRQGFTASTKAPPPSGTRVEEGRKALFWERMDCVSALASAITRGSRLSLTKSSRKCCSTERDATPVPALYTNALVLKHSF